MAAELAKNLSWVYISQNTGTGKTTAMLEIGYRMALDCLQEAPKSKIHVHLLVPSKE